MKLTQTPSQRFVVSFASVPPNSNPEPSIPLAMIHYHLSPCIIVQLPLHYLHFPSSFGLEWPIIPCLWYPYVLVVFLFLHCWARGCMWVTVAHVVTHEPASARQEFVLTMSGFLCNLTLSTGHYLGLSPLPGHRLPWNLQEMICHWYVDFCQMGS